MTSFLKLILKPFTANFFNNDPDELGEDSRQYIVDTLCSTENTVKQKDLELKSKDPHYTFRGWM